MNAISRAGPDAVPSTMKVTTSTVTSRPSFRWKTRSTGARAAAAVDTSGDSDSSGHHGWGGLVPMISCSA
jgi:hypothetical protein